MRKKSINSISSLVLLLLGFSIAATIFVSYWSIFATIILLIILVVIYPWEKEPAIQVNKAIQSQKKNQTPILSMTAEDAEKSVMHALRRKITEYDEMGEIGIWRSRMYGKDDFLFGYECELNAINKNLKDIGQDYDGEYNFCSIYTEFGRLGTINKKRTHHFSIYFNEKCNNIMKKLLHVGLEKSQEKVLLLSDYKLEELGVKLNPKYIALKLREVEIRYHIARIKEEQKQKEAEERKAQKDYERALKDAAKNEEKARLQLEKQQEALANAASEQEKIKLQEKITALETKLQEALAMKERALSMAQQTRIGYVYVISNVRSFGENVYKIGMTRRLEPMDRVRELSDASVPFAFDVHHMIYTDDAPKLEAQLHQKFSEARLNTDNFRKEFFRVPLTEITNTLKEIGVISNQ